MSRSLSLFLLNIAENINISFFPQLLWLLLVPAPLLFHLPLTIIVLIEPEDKFPLFIPQFSHFLSHVGSSSLHTKVLDLYPTLGNARCFLKDRDTKEEQLVSVSSARMSSRIRWNNEKPGSIVWTSYRLWLFKADQGFVISLFGGAGDEVIQNDKNIWEQWKTQGQGFCSNSICFPLAAPTMKRTPVGEGLPQFCLLPWSLVTILIFSFS